MGRKSYGLSFTHGKTLGKKLSGQFYSGILEILTGEFTLHSSRLPICPRSLLWALPGPTAAFTHFGVGHGAGKMKKGRKSAKETKRSQTHEQSKAAPAEDPPVCGASRKCFAITPSKRVKTSRDCKE